MEYKFKTGKVRGGYGETDLKNKVIKIDKSKHKRKGTKRITPNKDGSENMLTTIVHEMTHKRHPKMGEEKVEKLARAMKSRMGTKQKQRLYSKFK